MDLLVHDYVVQFLKIHIQNLHLKKRVLIMQWMFVVYRAKEYLIVGGYAVHYVLLFYHMDRV